MQMLKTSLRDHQAINMVVKQLLCTLCMLIILLKMLYRVFGKVI